MIWVYIARVERVTKYVQNMSDLVVFLLSGSTLIDVFIKPQIGHGIGSVLVIRLGQNVNTMSDVTN